MTQAVTATRTAQRAATAAKETRKGDEETADTKAVASRNAEWTSHATQDKPTLWAPQPQGSAKSPIFMFSLQK